MAGETTASPARARPLAAYIGFQKQSNFVFYVILSLAFGGFCLRHVYTMNPFNFCTAEVDMTKPNHAIPGECFHWRRSLRHFSGMTLHLASVVPAGLLAILQFTPVIRRRFPAFHRLAGYLSTIGILLGNVSAIMLLPTTFGGTPSTTSIAWCLAILNTYCLIKAIQEARAKRIAQHRAWMLRAWAYIGIIATMRPLLLIFGRFISLVPGYQQYFPMTCAEIHEVTQDAHIPRFMAYAPVNVTESWPLCDQQSLQYQPDTMVIVKATRFGSVVELNAMVRALFGTALWVALFFHAIAVEWYLSREASGKKSVRAAKAQ